MRHLDGAGHESGPVNGVLLFEAHRIHNIEIIQTAERQAGGPAAKHLITQDRDTGFAVLHELPGELQAGIDFRSLLTLIGVKVDVE